MKYLSYFFMLSFLVLVIAISGTTQGQEQESARADAAVSAGVDPNIAPNVNPAEYRERYMLKLLDNDVLYESGPFITSFGDGPGGSDVSLLQNVSLNMNTLGANVSPSGVGDHFRIANQFIVDDPGGWQLDSFVFFAYQTGSTTTSTFTTVNYQIWDGPPDDAGSNVIYGDTFTNRFVETDWTGVYRYAENNVGTTRPIMFIVAEADVELGEGTYWLDWQLDGTMESGPWQPPITIIGQTTTGNAKQLISTGWSEWVDTGTQTPQGGPFLIIGEILPYEPTARLQVIHNAADPAAASVDVYVNEEELLSGFGFREATPFIDVPAETELTIDITPAGSGTVVASFNVTLQDNFTYVVIANGVLNPDDFAVNPDGLDIEFTLFIMDDAREVATDPNEVQFFVVHGSTDAPSVDVVARGVATLVENVPYGGISDYLGVPAAEYIIDILPAGGTEPVASFDLDISGFAGETAVVIASGFLNPAVNQNGEEFILITVLADGTVLSIPADVDRFVPEIPMQYSISQNYPNPFNPSTTIRYALPERSSVKIEVFNTIGQRVTTLVDTELEAGYHDVTFDASSLTSGVYIYRIQAGSYVESKKMMLIK